MDGGAVSGVQTINATVTDAGGGARSIVVYVNGIASVSDNFCPQPLGGYPSLKPCPGSSGARALQLDTEHGAGWVNGSNAVRICGYDAAGNQSACIQRTVQVDNSCPGSGGSAATKLDAGAESRGQLVRRATVTSNDQPVVRGSLTDGSGQPVAGATVCVYQTTDLPDAGKEPVTRVTTQANGHFATRLDAGPSRVVDVAYRYNTIRLSDRVELDSTVVPVFRIPKKKRHSRNGQATAFKGWLPGPNADGRAVALQARTGRKWRTFKQLRTDPGGRFRGKYRFLHTRGGSAISSGRS